MRTRCCAEWNRFSKPIRPLYELAEAVAVPLLTSRHVMNGGFALDWLILKEMIPFLEARDDSESAARKIVERLQALGARLDFELWPDAPDMRRKLRIAAAPAAALELNRRKPTHPHFRHDLKWNFSRGRGRIAPLE